MSCIRSMMAARTKTMALPAAMPAAMAAAMAVLIACSDEPRPGGMDAGTIPPPPPASAGCGDGRLDQDEACDGLNFGELTCRDFGAFRGRLRCADDCARVITDDCEAGDGMDVVEPVCGDGIIEGDEACDTLPPEIDCAAIGAGEGPLGCTETCEFDTMACCRPAAEGCDGRDDDCDGVVDEESCSVGEFCVDGACQPQCTPRSERCNGSDDDCDLQSDEGFDVGRLCSVGEGRCQTMGVTVCTGDDAVACDARGASPTPETCDGEDEDCDGRVDEGGVCVEPCTPVDRCRAGARFNPTPDQRAPNDEGQVLALEVSRVDDCESIRLVASKRDGSDLGSGEYTLRVGDCRYFGSVRGQQTLEVPRGEITFVTDFRGAAGGFKDFCVTKAADSDNPDPHIDAWWFSNFARVERVIEDCP